MARPYQMVDMLYQPPKGSDPQRLDHHLNRWLPEGSKYYGYWGFTIYRTHYSPESDKQWKILLDALTRQTRLALGYYDSQSYEEEVMEQKDRNVPPMYYCKSQEEFQENLKQLKERFRLDTREDPSLDGLGVRELREVCLRDRPEAERTMAGFKFQYVLLADKAVFEAMDKGEFIIKAVSYTWEDGCSDWGWMRIPTGYLLDLWHRLMLRDKNGPRILPFRGPEEALEEYVWPSSLFLDETGDCSEVNEKHIEQSIGTSKSSTFKGMKGIRGGNLR
ncbi:hypothetical protein ACJ41O_005884 [Fusarium nematophilum]